MGDCGNCPNPTVASEEKDCEGSARQGKWENAGTKCGNESLAIENTDSEQGDIFKHRKMRQKGLMLIRKNTVRQAGQVLQIKLQSLGILRCMKIKQRESKLVETLAV